MRFGRSGAVPKRAGECRLAPVTTTLEAREHCGRHDGARVVRGIQQVTTTLEAREHCGGDALGCASVGDECGDAQCDIGVRT
ncbi:hypothetical protein [Candidatus Poriferisodalis sp.]|uniref:hypothetical protein n=1 Tax=Candidatus Poriferisodalis sp. TaxID=3101277 RepID=UPI003B021AA4